MKNSLLSLLLLLCVSTATMAQYDLSTGYVYSRPQQQMGDYIKNAHGLQFQALYRLPNSRLAFGAGIGFNGYGSETSRQTYRFSDGSTTETDVSVDNAFSTFALIGRLDLLPASIVTPYLTGQVGYSLYRTSLYIENPDDPDGCKPLENKALQTDGAFSVSGGGGLRWDLSSIIKKADKQRFFADISALYTQGGKVSYMNVNIPATTATHHNPMPASGDIISYSTKFINPVNQVVHEHHVGDVYSSYIQMMEFKVGFVYRISR